MSSEISIKNSKKEYIEQILTQCQPKRVLLVSCDRENILTDYLLANPDVGFVCIQGVVQFEHYSINERFDIAVVVGQIEKQSHNQGRHLIAYLRNIVCPQILMLMDKSNLVDNNWTDTDFFALGMQKNKVHDQVVSFSYDLGKYNHKRSWNTPQYWANPEQFHNKLAL